MRTITLQIDDSVSDKFLWLLDRFSKDEIKILDQSDYVSDEEYVEWGVRLGKDEKLRQEIVWKLRKSRQTSPLWNGKKFAREMENAYLQMWQRYIDS